MNVPADANGFVSQLALPGESTTSSASTAGRRRKPLIINARHRRILRAVFLNGQSFRRELHDLTGIRLNTVGTDAAALVEAGILRECEPVASEGGRPRTPLEIDPDRRRVIGLRIEENYAELSRMDLNGQRIGSVDSCRSGNPQLLVRIAAEMLTAHRGDDIIAIGVTVPQRDEEPSDRRESPAIRMGDRDISLKPILKAAADCPIVIKDFMEAVTARWLLSYRNEPDDQVTLVYLGNGRVRAAHLVAGQPLQGVTSGSSDLGALRVCVRDEGTDEPRLIRLDQVLSTSMLKGTELEGVPLEDLLQSEELRPQVAEILDHLAMVLANSIVLNKPHRLVLVTEMQMHTNAERYVADRVYGLLPRALAPVVRVIFQEQHVGPHADSAAWLQLANLYLEGWS